ncbi:MAG: MFS transporter [Candidatus Eremiobacteraeota bacterium]|nr:MFS transporter [Candidatus Eremiobacteraeota bacterium]
MAVLDTSIANVALPTLSRELHADVASTIWVVNAYQVAVTMLLLPLSSLGDVLGYRRVYATGLAVFTVGSLGCALSSTLLGLVLFRVLQGAGAAALMSIAPALNRTIFPARMLGVAVGISALTVASSAAAGPTIGGAILAIAPWPWLFAVNVPLGIFATAFVRRALPADRGRGGTIDIPSALMSGPALALLIVGLDGFARRVAPPSIAAMLGGSAILTFAFVRRQRVLPVPMLPLELFGIRRFSFAVVTSLCSFTAQGIAFVALPFLLQGSYGYSAFASGLLFTPWPLAIAVVAPLAGRLADRMSPARLSTAGLTVLALGLACLAALPAHPAPADIVWRGIVCGLGFGFFQAPNNREILGSAPRSRSASAAGVLATARLTGQSLGAAAVAIVLGTSVAAHATSAGMAAALARPAHGALWLSALVAAGAGAVSALRLTPLLTPASPPQT